MGPAFLPGVLWLVWDSVCTLLKPAHVHRSGGTVPQTKSGSGAADGTTAAEQPRSREGQVRGCGGRARWGGGTLRRPAVRARLPRLLRLSSSTWSPVPVRGCVLPPRPALPGEGVAFSRFAPVHTRLLGFEVLDAAGLALLPQGGRFWLRFLRSPVQGEGGLLNRCLALPPPAVGLGRGPLWVG